MKNIIITLAWLLLAPLAFAQPESTNKKQTTAEPITVTGGIIKMTAEEGSAASYQPLRTLVVREDSSKNADRYVLNAFGRVLDKTRESRPNRDQTRRSCPCFLRTHQRFACD